MPVSARSNPAEVDRLRPYAFHGVHLSSAGGHAVGDCPFCGREGKFSVDIETGLWRCFVCATGTERGGGNGLVFTRLLYERTFAARGPAEAASVAQERRLLSSAAVLAWGICGDPSGVWLVPGYGPDGRLDQVYRRIRVQDKGKWVWKLLPTPSIWPEGKAHALHLPAGDFDPARPFVDFFEGPWDGAAAWEVREVLGETNVIAVPGCNVWRDEWTQMCRGKHVRLWFDSDHPHEVVPGSGRASRAGFDGVVRVSGKLSGVAASVRWLRWGTDGYNPALPSGWDVRDELSGATTLDGRRSAMAGLLAACEEVPREWFNPTAVSSNGHVRGGGTLEARDCSKWADCEGAWREATRWRQDLADGMAVLLAVCASTQQGGNQLFLDFIGSPGSMKTTMCQGLLVSSNCVRLENVTKLLSGFQKPGENGKDCSFLARSNNKTWITCEFDVLGSSPEYHQLMGKVRRIFDGETSATYGNSDEDRIYTALRTPWIRAGTPRMMDRMADYDQSQLGDRFLRYIIRDPEDSERREIARSAARSERASLLCTANGTAGSVVDPKTRLAFGLTGGYVDWLRANVEEQLSRVDVPEAAEDFCIDLAELSADLRARPSEDRRKVDVHDVKEMPTRLARQNIRLAVCLAVVLNRPSVDADVLRIVKRVAFDTASGHPQNIVQWLCSPNPKADMRLYQDTGGLTQKSLAMWCQMTQDRIARYLGFLEKIGVLKRQRVQSWEAWVLTDRVYDLYLRVARG